MTTKTNQAMVTDRSTGNRNIKAVIVGSFLVLLLQTIPAAIQISSALTEFSLFDSVSDIPNNTTQIQVSSDQQSQNGTNTSLKILRKNEHQNESESESENESENENENEIESTSNTTIKDAIPSTTLDRGSETLSLLYPTGLVGGYRNQAMRFIGLLRHAIDENYDNILLPTLVWSTRYRTSKEKNRAEHLKINPAVKFWPVPFDELFDVDHWNTFHREGSENFPFPKLIASIEKKENKPTNNTVCWNSQTNHSIVSVSVVQRKHPDFKESSLPLLTQRMLFGNEQNDTTTNKTLFRQPFLLDPVEADAIEYLTGSTMAKRVHKVDVSGSVEQCTQPFVFGGNSAMLWYTYLGIDKAIKNAKKKKTGKTKKLAESYTKLIKTVEEALVPAKPWRILADRCVEHHLGLGKNDFLVEEENPHVIGHEHGYIALHSRVEPEMLDHKCGREMEQNLTKILDLVELFALDYNSPNGLPDYAQKRANQLFYSNPISNDLRQQLLSEQDHRPLKGAFVAVARAELLDYKSFKKFENITRYNRDVLNQRSISYDNNGNQTYSQRLDALEKRLEESNLSSRKLTQNNDVTNATKTLPIFECGEGWVEHAFYKSESRQKKLFTPPSIKDSSSNKAYGLYNKYGPQIQKGQENMPPTFPLLPLPQNYFGDLLPSMLNFWLAVRADVFVGVRKSSWSTHVWTARYYMGKGSKNFEYTSDRGILAIGNGGLPPAHKNC